MASLFEFLEENSSMGHFFLRWGIALTLLLSVRTKFMATGKVAKMMDSLGLGFMSSGLVQVLGVVLAVSALLLLFNKWTRANGVFLTLFFLVTIIVALPSGLTAGPAIWKDLGLLGAALALAFQGSGE